MFTLFEKGSSFAIVIVAIVAVHIWCNVEQFYSYIFRVRNEGGVEQVGQGIDDGLKNGCQCYHCSMKCVYVYS